ncbi:MAG: nitrate/nitrite transporter NrtS [Pseudomonadota bacterium]
MTPADHNPATMCVKPRFWAAAWERDTVSRALRVAAIVGTILVAINQGDLILSGVAPPIWKLVLTYCVPYSVSTYSVAAFKVMDRKSVAGPAKDRQGAA